MEQSGYTQANRIGKLHTDLGVDALLLLRMTAVERLSEPFTIVVDAVSHGPQPLHTLLGTNASIEFAADARTDLNRWFNGFIWEYTELEHDEQGHHYRLTLRPEQQFVSLNRDNCIYQGKTVKAIAGAVLNGTLTYKLSAAYTAIDYVVQYQESDFDFVSRLLEFEGIYYYYIHADGAHEMVLIDDRNAHPDAVVASVKHLPRDDARATAYVWSVIERRGIGPAKVVTHDYDFTAPTTDLKKTKAAAKPVGTPSARWGQSTAGTGGSVAWAEVGEVYDWPSKFDSAKAADGTRYSEVWLDANRRQMARSFAEGTLFSAAAGRNLTIDFPDEDGSSDYLIVGTTHRYAGPPYHSAQGEAEDLTVELELMPAAAQYRPAQRTPRPRIYGPQTALVVGPSGEEIYTDAYGRIKVQFHWDRLGTKNEDSSCFIRVVQSGAGKTWGSFTLPRIGQEVVVEFMDGDPDRPLVTGAVYNGDNVTPMALPDNKTQFGMRSRISKGGGGSNHWWVDDKKGEEVVWFRAERDYKAHIVNQDEERQYDKGNRKTTFNEGNDELIITKGTRTETIEGNDTKTIKTGNRTVTINTGNQETTVKTGNFETTVNTGDETRSVKLGKRTTTIQMDETLEVKMGNRKTTLSLGNDSLSVKLGNVDIKLDLGAHKTEALQSIELKCGMSSIKMTPASIEIKSLMVKVEATVMLETKGLMIQQQGTAMHIVKGGLVMIN